MTMRLAASEVAAEFGDVRLGDRRLDERLLEIAKAMGAAPSSSFPVAFRDSSEREALYRFFANDKVSLEGVLSGHIAQTLLRSVEVGRIRVVHDTTTLVYRGDREGLGPIKGAGQGFFAHLALAVSDDEQRNALGVLGATTYANEKDSPRRKMTHSERVAYSRSLPRAQKQSSRWESLAHAIHNSLPPQVEAVHVMDQEADDFTLLWELVSGGLRFVIRGSGARVTGSAHESIAQVLNGTAGKLFREVRLNPRSVYKSRGTGRPARAERTAELFVRWSRLEIARPENVGAELPRTLPVGVVHVYEPQPPDGEGPIEWFLFTSEEVDSIEEATRIVDHYRARWVIEDFFKALKTGCAIEKRQLTTYEGLNKVLGLLLPIAWRLLVLRQLSREPKPRPGSAVMNKSQLTLLRALLRKRRTNHTLAARPTVRDVMLAIAALGGHIRNNGEPGWIVLGRGYEDFLLAEVGWSAAHDARSDQS